MAKTALIELLNSAAHRGRVDQCRTLLEAGAPVNASMGWPSGTALDRAAAEGHADVVKLLLDAGARVDGQPQDSAPPLYQACRFGHLEVVRHLVDAGADIHRESLERPMTPTGAAEYWSSFTHKNPGEVGCYMRSIGGISPYFDVPEGASEDDRWKGVDGELHTDLLEAGLFGRVSLVPFEREISGRKVIIRQCRFVAQKYLFRALCTVNLSKQQRLELAIALPSTWPLHAAALKEQRYVWPLELLYHLAGKLTQGASLAHGDLLAHDGDLLRDTFTPSDIAQWLVVRHQSVEARRLTVPLAGLGTTLFLVPHVGKPVKPGDAKARADTKAMVKWEKPALGTGRNALVVPLPASDDAACDGVELSQ